MNIEVKTVGSSGQISLGKQYAGRTVVVEEIEAGVWLVKTARVIPDGEMWLEAPSVRESLDRAVEWAEKNPPQESDLETLGNKIERRR